MLAVYLFKSSVVMDFHSKLTEWEQQEEFLMRPQKQKIIKAYMRKKLNLVLQCYL